MEVFDVYFLVASLMYRYNDGKPHSTHTTWTLTPDCESSVVMLLELTGLRSLLSVSRDVFEPRLRRSPLDDALVEEVAPSSSRMSQRFHLN